MVFSYGLPALQPYDLEKAMVKKASKTDELAFEESLAQLEGIVARLEEGSLSLEESLEAFEEGMKLYRRCALVLENARQRVEKLLKEGEILTTAPIDLSGEAGEE